eukprot:5747009-Prorocentrum_lima.AAC.1
MPFVVSLGSHPPLPVSLLAVRRQFANCREGQQLSGSCALHIVNTARHAVVRKERGSDDEY